VGFTLYVAGVVVQFKDFGTRQNFNLIIIAIKKPDGGMLFNPSFEAAIMPGDTVIAVGEEENLQKLAKILDPKVNVDRSKDKS
jgi:voltage-gated potassium channel